jgi:hypothetical protein
MNAERMENWQQWLVDFPAPYFEDDKVIVYATQPDLGIALLDREGVNAVDVRVGSQIRLRGYRLSSDNLTAGEPLTVTLLWQSDSRLDKDLNVFVHLLDTDGRLVAQRDGVPVQGERPTWSWWDREVIQDEYVLATDFQLPSGIYTVAVGMYELPSGDRLEVVDPAGERLPDDRIVLEKIKVGGP